MDKEIILTNNIELSKRFYVPGVILEHKCNCGEIIKKDLGDNYLSYPVSGELEKIYLYCDKCEKEYEQEVQIDIKVTIGKVEEL